MNKDEELELLLEVYREQSMSNAQDKTLKELTDMVEVRNVNFSIEQKLDKIIELLERLVPKEIEIKSGVSINTYFDAAKFNEVLKRITNRISRASEVSPRIISKEEFVTRLQEIDVDKLVKEESKKVTNEIDWTKIPGAKIRLLDEKGKGIGVKCDIKEDGSVVCEPFKSKEATIVNWGLKKKVYKVRVCDAAKVFIGWLGDDGVVELLKAKHPISAIDKPFTYYQDWYISHEDSLSNYTFFTPKNLILEIPAKDVNYKQYPSKILENCVTGHITDDGRVIYYDQYI